MADTTKNEYNLKAQFKYTNNDTRLFTFPNPKSNLPEMVDTVRTTLENFGATTLSDKDNNSSFTQVTTAYIEERAITELDLTNITPPSA